MNRALPVITQIQHFGAARNVLLGAGIAYAISEEKYTHVPVAFVFPSIYAGYQAYKNREAIVNFAESSVSKTTSNPGTKTASFSVGLPGCPAVRVTRSFADVEGTSKGKDESFSDLAKQIKNQKHE
jgi:hypothetical protein